MFRFALKLLSSLRIVKDWFRFLSGLNFWQITTILLVCSNVFFLWQWNNSSKSALKYQHKRKLCVEARLRERAEDRIRAADDRARAAEDYALRLRELDPIILHSKETVLHYEQTAEGNEFCVMPHRMPDLIETRSRLFPPVDPGRSEGAVPPNVEADAGGADPR